MPPKKETKPDLVVEIGFILIVLLFLWVIWSTIYRYIISSTVGSSKALWALISGFFLHYIYPILIILAVVLSVLSIFGIVRNYRRLSALNKEEEEIYGSTKLKKEEEVTEDKKNGRWNQVIAHLNSPNENDWRLAIIEADVMLDEMLRAEGYVGDSIGDMLKGVDKSDMKTLDAAWEAHKIRNEIVHSGSDYQLNEHQAKHVMRLYEAVFKEFDMI